MPHQTAFLKWAKSRGHAASFMQMRLGKSLCAVRWARSRPSSDKVLVACPLSVVPGWVREFRAEGLDAHELTGTDAQKRRAVETAGRDGRFYVTNREALLSRKGKRTVPSWIATAPWDVVVFDESTTIRNPKAKVTRCALEHLSSAPHRLILSGLPNPEGPQDFVTQMMFVRGGEFMGHDSFWTWRQEYMQPAPFSGWTVLGKHLPAIRNAVGEDSYFLTRRQAGMPDEKVRSTRWVQLPPRVRAAVAQAEKDFRVGDRLTSSRLATLEWVSQLCGGRYAGDAALHHDAKYSELVELARGELAGGKFLVWARHTAELKAAFDALRNAGVTASLVHGQMDKAARAAELDAFVHGRRRALVAQPRCLGVGVDLSVADVAVVISNYADHEVRAQMEDRIVHPKKDRPALTIDIVARDTWDEDVLESLVEKGVDSRTFNSRLFERMARRVAS